MSDIPLSDDEILSVAEQLANTENLQVTLKESFKGASIAAGGAFLGGILGGPIGLAAGGTLASMLAAWKGSKKFKSVALVIKEDLSPQQRANLANSLRTALQEIQFEDVIMFTSMVLGNAVVKQLVVTEMCNYLGSETGLAMRRKS